MREKGELASSAVMRKLLHQTYEVSEDSVAQILDVHQLGKAKSLRCVAPEYA